MLFLKIAGKVFGTALLGTLIFVLFGFLVYLSVRVSNYIIPNRDVAGLVAFVFDFLLFISYWIYSNETDGGWR